MLIQKTEPNFPPLAAQGIDTHLQKQGRKYSHYVVLLMEKNKIFSLLHKSQKGLSPMGFQLLNGSDYHLTCYNAIYNLLTIVFMRTEIGWNC